jgi:hypothetical protein
MFNILSKSTKAYEEYGYDPS